MSVQEIAARVRAEDADIAYAALFPNGWPHEAPDHPLSVPEAHQTMQRHRECRTDECPRKAAAWTTLVDSGKVKPDSGRNY
ncbi:hypothetical protein NDR87_06145 [Nocardia sp. CDC159]|uniref:Uncharacterized protein n=1 Tax=Nocardia pulmonis TaxID=2951408 RepID=A0A9X2E2M1_9NOCA|nr:MULTISPECIES: hypothetical protein [Nocardia]MCM6772759.1 hypothetical protein [Nocardia pulmonis]MCM6785938.1 hypothetical protein [Nocardia sp. CDC159]